MGPTSKPQQRLRNSDLKLPQKDTNSNTSRQLNGKRTLSLVTLDLDRKVPDSPFLLRDAGGGSQTYKSNFYSEELTVQYLKRKSLGKRLLPAPSQSVCVWPSAQERRSANATRHRADWGEPGPVGWEPLAFGVPGAGGGLSPASCFPPQRALPPSGDGEEDEGGTGEG